MDRIPMSHYNLGRMLEENSTVCHKYRFINHFTSVNTQAVESFHDEIKLEIKRRKGVRTQNRALFINKFVFCFDSRDIFIFLLNSIKI